MSIKYGDSSPENGDVYPETKVGMIFDALMMIFLCNFIIMPHNDLTPANGLRHSKLDIASFYLKSSESDLRPTNYS